MAVKSEEDLFLLLTNSILEFKDFVDITNYVISIYDRILFKICKTNFVFRNSVWENRFEYFFVRKKLRLRLEDKNETFRLLQAKFGVTTIRI